MAVTRNEKPKTFLQKIAAAASEMDNPKKRSDNPFFKSKFANLSDTMDIIEPVMEKYGLAHIFYFDGTAITYQVFDGETGETMLSKLELGGILAGLEGNVWQGVGQAFTYMRRYLSQAFWGLIPVDDDAQSAPSRPAAQRRQAQQNVSLPPSPTQSLEHSNGGGAL